LNLTIKDGKIWGPELVGVSNIKAWDPSMLKTGSRPD
jgi:hypothetical protein